MANPVQILSKVFQYIPYVFQAIDFVELFVAKKGREKQDAAVELVGNFISLIEGAIGKEILNQGKVQEALRHLIDAAIAFENVVREAKANRAK